jgi:hypothetical protein
VIVPFLSPKSYRKIYPLESLVLLHRSHSVSLAGIKLSIPILLDESRVISERTDLFPSANATQYGQLKPVATGWLDGLRGAIGAASSYLPYGYTSPYTGNECVKDGWYGRTADELIQESSSLPAFMDDLRAAILQECSSTEGIFRATPKVSQHLLSTMTDDLQATLRQPLIALLSLPSEDQPFYPWSAIARFDPFLLPKMLMRIFSTSPSPYIPPGLYPSIRRVQSASE